MRLILVGSFVGSCIGIMAGGCIAGNAHQTSNIPEQGETAKPKTETDPALVSPSENPDAIPVLLYHDLAPKNECCDNPKGVIVPVEEFQAQIAWLKENGYSTPTLSEFHDWLTGSGVLPQKSILITFDDGYISFKNYAVPILEEHGLSAVVFLIGERPVGPRAKTEFLGWDDIISIEESNAAVFQSHTYDGHYGTGQNPEIGSWSAEQLSKDFDALEESFINNGLSKPHAFAYPFGFKNDTITKVLCDRDYSLAFTTKHGFVHRHHDPLELNRIIIWPETGLDQFEQKVTVSPCT